MTFPRKFNLEYFFKIYFYIMLIELFIGGAGRLITIGNLTLRMYFFIGAIIILIVYIFSGNKITIISKTLTITFGILFTWSVINGLMNNADNVLLFEDAKMASFFFILPFFDFLINSRKTIIVIINLLKIVSLFMATTYIVILLGLYFEFIKFDELYYLLSKEEFANEFAFRGQGAIIYKGFVYMCMGFFFFLFEDNLILKTISCFIILLAIVLTLTRGLIVAIGIITIPYFIYQYVYKKKKIVIGAFIILIIIFMSLHFAPIYLENLGDKSESDAVRTIQVNQVIERIDWNSWLIGHGYGIGVPIRMGHFEITYLELFHKQGILGLIYWFSILCLIILLYLRCSTDDRKITTPLLLSVFFLYIESASNPFLINSIGLTPIFISIITFYKIPKLK